jgi:hypothetical protein
LTSQVFNQRTKQNQFALMSQTNEQKLKQLQNLNQQQKLNELQRLKQLQLLKQQQKLKAIQQQKLKITPIIKTQTIFPTILIPPIKKQRLKRPTKKRKGFKSETGYLLQPTLAGALYGRRGTKRLSQITGFEVFR